MFCAKCGTENVNNAQFCIKCGTDLSNLTPISRRTKQAGDDTIDVSATMVERKFKEGTILAGQYKIIGNEPLGAGGMGEVWKAQDIELGTTVAIKVLPPILARDKSAIENLKREAMIGQQLTHQNICRLYGFHADGDIKFIVMEYVDGETLKDLLRKKENQKLTWQQVKPWAVQIAQALDYAHHAPYQDPSGKSFKGVLHRDIKPANIMITKEGQAKLMDFGIAREIHNTMTQLTGRTSQTPMYASPEQFRGQPMNTASDIYSFTSVLYECLAGFPFVSPSGSLEYQILQKEFESLSSQSEEVNAILASGLAKDPAKRNTVFEKLIQWPKQKNSIDSIEESLKPDGVIPLPPQESSVQKTLITTPDSLPIKKKQKNNVAKIIAVFVVITIFIALVVISNSFSQKRLFAHLQSNIDKLKSVQNAIPTFKQQIFNEALNLISNNTSLEDKNVQQRLSPLSESNCYLELYATKIQQLLIEIEQICKQYQQGSMSSTKTLKAKIEEVKSYVGLSDQSIDNRTQKIKELIGEVGKEILSDSKTAFLKEFKAYAEDIVAIKIASEKGQLGIVQKIEAKYPEDKRFSGFSQIAREKLNTLSRRIVRVYANNEKFTDAGRVFKGEKVLITADGSWLISSRSCDAGGMKRAIVAGKQFGYLEGIIGSNGEPQVYGKNYGFTVSDNDVLWLRANDDNFSDNSGYIDVTIEVSNYEEIHFQ